MAKQSNPDQFDLFDDWLVVGAQPIIPVTLNSEATLAQSFDESRHVLALRLSQKLNAEGEITTQFLTEAANQAFGGTQAQRTYSTKDAYDALEAAFNIHLLSTEDSGWTEQGAEWARTKAIELTSRIQKLPTQTKRDEEMDEFQQFSTPPALSFVANWVANVKRDDVMVEPSAGTGDLAVWPEIAGAVVILNELAPRRQALLSALFPKARLFKENAEQLDNVLPTDIAPTVILMNPPFSSTAGRVHGQRDTTNGARHIEQALKRLAEGGRLVAIAGNGMAADRPAFSQWWEYIAKNYHVRANVGISGKEYAKYGTSFDNQILVIDKTGATTQPVLTGKVEAVADLPTLLEGIRNDRQRIQSNITKPAVKADTRSKSDSVQPGNGIGGVGIGKDGAGTQSIGNRADSGAITTDRQTGSETPVGDGGNDGIGAGDGIRVNPVGDVGGSGGGDTGGNSGVPKSDSPTRITVEVKNGNIPEEFTDSVFANYTPQRLTIQGAQQHPGKLVQSAAMSAVEPPLPSYAPVLPANLIKDGLLSIAQLEALVYAGQAHSELLPNGSRKGFFIGDGTGVGKGREIAGIILDNMMQGRNKAVWISFNEGLLEDAKRDFAGIGGDPGKIFFQGKTKAGNEITQEEGILFTTYSTLRGGEKKQANDLGQEGGKTRAQQIINWLGEDFDGVIAFDEAHSMGNAIAVKGKRGVRKPSQQAIAGINLQRELPNARITYVSATGATEVSNLSYADRLGLWGEGTPFADVNAFIAGVTKGGIASMELISRDMKAMGLYLARSLSYDGVSYERREHTLSDFQEAIYNELAGAWQIVLNNVEQALEITQAGSSVNAKSAAMAQFWGAHQRFFNQIITAMQTPRVIDDIREQLEAGHVAVIQLVNTNEAAQERIIAEATAHNTALEDLDFTPRQMLMDYVRNGFPVAAYEESKDDNGNTLYVPVRDSEGNPVFDREAIALRDALLETLHQIRVPENPLDSIINAFGSDRVAEITGRSRRFVQTRDDDGNYQVVEEKRGKNSARADAEAFQANKKDILVFSGAGGTGYSFHADNTAANQRKRIHYILQPGWRADAAVQGFGRTHRTNQANAPHYVLPTTNMKAQKRFVSSIARRLDQLGALTRGQREATSQGMFTAADNLESHYAAIALTNFFTDLYRGKTDLSFHDVTQQMGLNLLDENGALSETKMPGIPQFLNRLLSLKTDRQNAVFAEFENRLVEAVEYAKQQGLYDLGLQTLTAASIKKTREHVVYEDKQTGAQTRYVELAVTTDVSYYDWNDVTRLTQRRQNLDDLSGWFVSEFGKNKGEVFFMSDLGGRLDAEGNAVRRGVIHSIKKNGHRYIDNADVMSRGWDYRTVTVNGVDSYQKVTLTRPIDKVEAEKLWHEQVANAPKTETRIERMIVGVILPIWDRVEGSETIKRLQTDEGEQLLGRMLGLKSAKQTLKNLGLDSGLSNRSANDLFQSIKDGNKAVLSNGWIIATARVNHESRIEIKGRSSFTDAERRVLKDQGAFIERINWAERVFIPSGDQGLDVFKRITESKPVIDLLGLKNPIKQETDNEINKTTESPETTGSNPSIFNTGGTNAPETGRERVLFPTSKLSGEKPARGQYATETELISESRRLLTVDRITTVDQAAQAALSVSVQAVERFDALVTDKEGKPLAIVGSFKGTINSASVYPAVVAAEAFRIPDAAHIYFYHNHPSGTTKLSDADLAITRKLQRVFDGSGITAHGIFAITTNGSFSYENPATREVVDGVAQAGAAAVSVPIIERIISFDEKMGAGVTSPDISKSLIPKLFNESGLMLLNNQHEPVGFMPISPGEALPLKHTGMTDNLFLALSMSNAAAAILYDSEHHYSVEQYQNIGEFLDAIDVRLLDVLVKQENPNSSGASVMISGAELGWSFRSSTGVFLNDIPSISLVEKSNTKKVSQMSSLSKDKKAFHEMVAEKLIQQLKEGTAPWQRPWVPGESGTFLPYNPVTGNRYKGINSIQLLSQDRDDQRWMTYKQATALGGQVRKGEKGTGVQYWKFTEEQIKKDEDGKPVLDSEGNPVKEVVRLERPRGFFAMVFNGEQIDGLPPLQKQEHTWDPIERAEGILTSSGSDIHHNGGSRAFYRPLTDSIHLPDKGQFPSAENYYATALHELGHWTGKEDRLNRDISHPFGSEGYAKEELRAEIASMILGDELGIGHDPSQHASYVGSWIKALNDDPMEIFRAAADAERIQDYVLGLEQKQVQEQTAQLAQNQTQSENRLTSEDVMTLNIADVTIALITAVVSGIEQAQASIADWNDEAVQGVANEKAAEAIELVRQGKFDRALDNLRTAAELEEKHTDCMSHSYEAVANALEAGWRSWQQDKGVGKAITPEMAASFEAIPTDLAQLSHATAADYEKAVQRARLEEERVKANPNSTSEDITAARELRKTAELAATVNSEAFQRKVLEIEQQQRQPSTQKQVVGEQGQSDKTYLQVPYKEKNQAKELGAKWDRGKQSWYVPAAVDLAVFAKWAQAVKALKPAQTESVQAEATPTDRQYLAVPYTERAIAKGAGARWDKDTKSWYAGPMADMNTLKQWLPENVKLQQAPAMTPREEFADALSSLGCIVKGEHPVMDGKTHRIATVGDKPGERAGFYVAHLDGHPAGHIQNNRTGQTMKWKAKGYSLSEDEKAQLQATSAAKLQEREAAQKAQQNTVANFVRDLLAVAPLASAEHPYLQAKQARPGDLRVVPEDSGALPETCPILIGKDWKESKALRESNPDKLVFTAGDLLLAAQDISGAVRSVQAIQGNGLKRFAAGGAKQDTFHVVGGQGLAALEKALAIVIGEGYATADTLSQALGYPTVAAFDSGNLLNVAMLLHEKFPEKPFIIAGDNDLHLELTEGRNPGKEKAVAAAKAVNGTVLLPIFAPGEQTYPAYLEPVTPIKARKGDLSDKQRAALAQMKLFTDFNDLATRSALGEGGVERQVTTIVNSLVARNQKPIEIKQQQERVEKLEQQPRQRKVVKI